MNLIEKYVDLIFYMIIDSFEQGVYYNVDTTFWLLQDAGVGSKVFITEANCKSFQ
jgi:hypothetical protein